MLYLNRYLWWWVAAISQQRDWRALFASKLPQTPFSKMFAAGHSIYSMKPGLNPGFKVDLS
jgi:hypothetical protein